MTVHAASGRGTPADETDAHTLTGRARRWLLRKLPPDKLLPEDQPSFVASWAYVFGMGAIAALLWIVVSGIVLGLNGPQWYHLSSLGSFVNSTHLWSVELFFIFMVVHLWLKFWMAAWRGGRVLTWITGVISFVVSIVAAFTGYLLQTNFDSQWIAFEAKDALNAVGVGAWFNVANVGQLFTWHVTLLPLAVGAVVVLHVLLVRVHGVAPPLEAAESDAQLLHSRPEATESGGRSAMTRRGSSTSWRKADDVASRPWTGSVREYDLIKELIIGVVVVGLLVLGVSAIFGSPDEPSVSLKAWATAAPADFVGTAAKELAGTSDTAGYGPPYNSTPDATQNLGPVDLQSLSGVRLPVDTANDFVIIPLSTLPSPPVALARWKAATEQQRSDWAAAYSDALDAAPDNDPTKVAAGDYGPVPALTGALLDMARQGNLDGVLQSGGNFYNMDYTRSLLFLGDGGYFPDLAASQHLSGDQWGVMNETGDTPGQSWLWLFSLLYQVEPFKSAPNADALVVVTMLVLTALLALLPFIPGLRALPRLIPLHRLIWKDYYRNR